MGWHKQTYDERRGEGGKRKEFEMVEKMEGLEKLEKCFKNLDSPATSGSGMEAAKPILYWCILRLHLWKTVEEPHLRLLHFLYQNLLGT